MRIFSTPPPKKPELNPGEGFHEFADRIIQWKKDIKNHPSNHLLYNRIIVSKINLKNYIFRNSGMLIIMAFITWGFIHLLFSRNETYSIYFANRYYLQNASEHVYNEYVYKLPNDYGNRLVAGTTKTYFGKFPEWFGNYIMGGYYILSLLAVYVETRKNHWKEKH